jgi:hypothetical protein
MEHRSNRATGSADVTAPSIGPGKFANDANAKHQSVRDCTGVEVKAEVISDCHETDVNAESARVISPRATHRSGRDTLVSSGSCHRMKAAAFH